MSNESLGTAQDVLLVLLSNEGPMDPPAFLGLARQALQETPVEHLRIALWGLLGSGKVVRSADNKLMLATPAVAVG
jgi:hypothetical protein